MLRRNRKKYSGVRWRVDGSNNLYVYNENELLFTRAECFDYDEKIVADIISEEYGDDWCFAYESADYEEESDDDTTDDDDDDDDDEDADELPDIDDSLSDGIPDISALSDGKEE